LVYGQRDAVAAGPAPGARAATGIVRQGQRDRAGRQRDRDRNSDRRWRSPSRSGKVVGRNRHARRGGRRRDDHDRGDHADHQPHDHADENDRETKKEDLGRGIGIAAKVRGRGGERAEIFVAVRVQYRRRNDAGV